MSRHRDRERIMGKHFHMKKVQIKAGQCSTQEELSNTNLGTLQVTP